MISQKTKEMAEKIGQIYLEKNGNDYVKTEEEIKMIGFREIIVTPSVIVVKVKHPGIFMGKRGTNIDWLERSLGFKIHIIEVMEEIEDYIIPYEE